MDRKLGIGIPLVIGIIILLYWGCGIGCGDRGNVQCEQLYTKVEKSIPNHFGEDCMNDDAWKELSKIEIPKGLRDCNLLGADGELNRDSVVALFKLKPCRELSYKIYLEASGSMRYYDNSTMSGGIRTCVQKFYSYTGSSKKSLAYVSDKVYKATDVIDEVLGEANNELYTQARLKNVESGQTLFQDIFSSVLAERGVTDISVVISDMCYSRSGEVNSERLAEQALDAMFKIFSDRGNALDVLIMQFSGPYDGPYYNYKWQRGDPTPPTWKDNRPYYLLFLAHHDAMEEFLKYEGQLKNWKKHVSENAKNSILFRNYSDTIADFFWLSSSSGCQGRDIDYGIQGLHKGHSSDNSVYVAINLHDVFADSTYLLNTKNWSLGESQEFELERIIQGKEFRKDNNLSGSEDKKWEQVNPSHVLKLILKENSPKNGSELNIRLKWKIPDWVVNSSIPDDTDTNHPRFKTTTFVFKDMIEGIRQAYHQSDEPTIKSIQLKFID